MQKSANDTLSLLKEEGRQLIQQNNKEFRCLLSQAKKLAEYRKYDAAVAYAQIAAFHAQLSHCGFFASPELEQLLLAIGQKAIPVHSPVKRDLSLGSPRKVLHIATNVTMIGGIPKLLQRWIQQDNLSSHSVALTKQAPEEVPKTLQDLVCESQGEIFILNKRIGGLISRAKRLRECAAVADIIVLHSLEHDVVPMIAFANKKQLPPIVYTNHGDHWFWLGVGISDVVANLRESGMRLAQHRRGVEARRSILLPTILEPAHRRLSQVEAKQQLGIDENSIMLLSIARVAKYRTIDGTSFADAHVQLLKQYRQAILVIVGPGDGDENWSAAIEETQGRIRVLGQTKDTAMFYQAADIYVDSFPFVSITSLLEAGSYGVPLVSRYPYPSDACEILGADMPGLTGNLIRTRDLEEYTEILSRLIEDREFRLLLGETTKRKIEETHWGESWLHSLNKVYSCAKTLPQVRANLNSRDEMVLDEPDAFLPPINKVDINSIIHWQMALIPFNERLRLWLYLVKQHGIRSNPLNLLLPEQLRWRYYALRSQVLDLLQAYQYFKFKHHKN
jgi:glycosyltransferase involved in cell wall biosynthesis